MKFFWIVPILLLLFIAERAAEHFYKKTDIYAKTLGGADRFLKSVPEHLEIVNIGSGPGLYDITYDHCRRKGFNFSTAPQNYKNGFRLLRRFAQNLSMNCIVIIVIMCPLSFGENEDYSQKSYMDKFYGILPKEDIDGYSIKRKLFLRHTFLMKLFGKTKNILYKGTQKREFRKGQPELISTWEREFHLENLTDAGQAKAHEQAFQEKIRILEEGIRYCREKTWRPVMVIPPVPRRTRAYISDEFTKRFVYDNLAVLQSDNPDVPLLDYFKDKRFGDDCFSGDIFMNSNGQTRFSELLFQDIDSLFCKGD